MFRPDLNSACAMFQVERVNLHLRRNGRGRSRGLERTPPLTSKRSKLSIPPFESGPLVSLLLRITAVQTSLVVATVCEFVHGGPARNARVITRANKLLVQALRSCPSEVTSCTCCSANLTSRENSKSAALVNAYMDS